MASYFDSREALTAIASVLTAYTSATGVSTASFASSIASQVSADTSLTAWESKILSQVSTGLGSVTPSTSIHSSPNLGFAVDNRTLAAVTASLLTAWSSASGVTTGNLATQFSSQITVDTGLTNVEKGLVTLLTSAIASATPSASFHNSVGSVDIMQLLTWFASSMRALCLTHASGTTTNVTDLAASIVSMNTNDTGLTAVEKAICTSISSAVSATAPSCGIHSGLIG